MELKFEKGIKEIGDLQRINMLNKGVFDEKYLLGIEDYEERLQVNKNQIFLSKNTDGKIIGYISIVPVDEKSYQRLLNGEIDKEVISKENIIGDKNKVEYIYIDSLVIDEEYREFRVGQRLYNFAINEVENMYPHLMTMQSHIISTGGYKILNKVGFKEYKIVDDKTKILVKEYNKKYTI